MHETLDCFRPDCRCYFIGQRVKSRCGAACRSSESYAEKNWHEAVERCLGDGALEFQSDGGRDIRLATTSAGFSRFCVLRQPDGAYLVADASGVEVGNFVKLGFLPRADYERFETIPVEWLHRDDGLFQVRIRTRAWKAGQRYTVYEPLIIRPDGTVLYR